MRSARDKNARQQALIDDALATGRSVVVDNTNATRAERAPLLALARKHGARAVAVFLDAPVADCRARNAARAGRARVPDVAIFATLRRLEPPTTGEGFDAVETIAPR